MKGNHIKCPNCGRIIHKNGYPRHKNSIRCEIRKKREELKNKGYEPFSSTFYEKVQELGGKPFMAPYKVHENSDGSNAVVMWWAKKDIVNEAKQQKFTTQFYDDDGGYHRRTDRKCPIIKKNDQYVAIQIYYWDDNYNKKNEPRLFKVTEDIDLRWNKKVYWDAYHNIIFTLDKNKIGEQVSLSLTPPEWENEIVARVL